MHESHLLIVIIIIRCTSVSGVQGLINDSEPSNLAGVSSQQVKRDSERKRYGWRSHVITNKFKKELHLRTMK